MSKSIGIVKFLFLAIVGYICLGTSIAQAAYIITSGGNCYDDAAHMVVDMSFCVGGPSPSSSSSSATAEGILTNILTPTSTTTSKGNTLRYEPGQESCHYSSYSTQCSTYNYYTDEHGDRWPFRSRSCSKISERESCEYYDETGKLTKKCKGTEENCTTFGVTPSAGKFFVSNLSIDPDYTNTRVDAAGSLLGTAQHMKTYGVAISYMQDFGDWGYSLMIPLRHTNNNSVYSALDNTQVGITLAPTYHLFKEQVHGMTLDLGGLIGYSHTSFSDVSAVRDPSGTYNYSDFGNLNTTFASFNVMFSKQLQPNTRLALTANAIEYDNSGAGSMMGNTGNMLLASVGLSQAVSSKLLMNASVQAVQFKQNTFDTKSNYCSLALGANYNINNRSSVLFNLTQSVNADHLNMTSANLTYKMELQ
jgi:hypothetical protein